MTLCHDKDDYHHPPPLSSLWTGAVGVQTVIEFQGRWLASWSYMWVLHTLDLRFASGAALLFLLTKATTTTTKATTTVMTIIMINTMRGRQAGYQATSRVNHGLYWLLILWCFVILSWCFFSVLFDLTMWWRREELDCFRVWVECHAITFTSQLELIQKIKEEEWSVVSGNCRYNCTSVFRAPKSFMTCLFFSVWLLRDIYCSLSLLFMLLSIYVF